MLNWLEHGLLSWSIKYAVVMMNVYTPCVMWQVCYIAWSLVPRLTESSPAVSHASPVVSATGGHVQKRFWSPKASSTLATLGQNFFSRRYGSGYAAFSRV